LVPHRDRPVTGVFCFVVRECTMSGVCGSIKLQSRFPRMTFVSGVAMPHNDLPVVRNRLVADDKAVAWETLTRQELTIARMVGEAMTNRQIASRVHLSIHGVNWHLRQMFRKLNIFSRVQLATLAQLHLAEDR
jgi:DNA-binding CsgD family transcriptional regulator